MTAINLDEEASVIMEKAKNLGINKKTLASFLIKKYAHFHMNFEKEKLQTE